MPYAANYPELREVFSIAGDGAAIRAYKLNPERRKMLDTIFDALTSRPDIVRFGSAGKAATIKKVVDTYVLRELNRPITRVNPRNQIPKIFAGILIKCGEYFNKMCTLICRKYG